MDNFLAVWSYGKLSAKGPVKLIKQVKIAHSFLQSVLNQFHVTILRLLIVILQMAGKQYFQNSLLKMEIQATLTFGVIFDQP